MATTIVLKNSVTTTNVPSSLTQGEVAVNVTDKKVWVGNAATTPIQLLGSGADGVFSSVTDTGLTITRLTYAGTGGLLKDSANIVTDGSKITTSTGFVGGPWTTATRPASPATGQEGFNTTLGIVEAYNGTAWFAAATIVPTVTTYTSGSGTYTTPTGAKYLFVRMVGGGGGGAGGSGGGGGGNGGNSTFGSSLTASGSGGPFAPGTASGGDLNITGGAGSYPETNVVQATGIAGGNSVFGGAGGSVGYSNSGTAASANSGSGGASGSAAVGTGVPGISGSSGGYLEKTISSPASTYSYAVGAGGTGGSAGSGAGAGGNGGSGVIIVTAFF